MAAAAATAAAEARRRAAGSAVLSVLRAGEAIGAWWRSAEPWTKWPIAVFVPWLCAVVLVFGPHVARDLMPLWLLGPLLTSVAIHRGITAASAGQRVLSAAYQAGNQGAHRAAGLVADVRSGRLAEAAQGKRAELARRKDEVVGLLAARREGLVHSAESGELADIARAAAEARFQRLLDWLQDVYGDLDDWWRPRRRSLTRLLQKLF
eukprot:SM000076S21860  [mRNA]  locus=s76:489177:490876:- [translate_table: standard]